MKKMFARLRPGDLVDVMTPDEILQTLDSEGTLDQMPFMPEMVQYCAKRFHVSRRIDKTCFYGAVSTMREFRGDDVVTLDGLRCSGADHDGCQKACMIFWREAWLRKVQDNHPVQRVESDSIARLRARLKTSTGPNTYFCQASQLWLATNHLPQWKRVLKCFSTVRAGNCTVWEMAERISVWLFWRIRRMFRGQYARGNRKSTPAGSLNLHSGELVEVQPMEKITETTNARGYNRGLSFSPGMRLLCEQQRCVERKLEKIIVDGTGEMRQLHDTVYLEGSYCSCAHVALGGCPRGEFAYWREIWLRHPPRSS
jgi:hypothetical protein